MFWGGGVVGEVLLKSHWEEVRTHTLFSLLPSTNFTAISDKGKGLTTLLQCPSRQAENSYTTALSSEGERCDYIQIMKAEPLSETCLRRQFPVHPTLRSKDNVWLHK